ncbi:MAG: AmmeMemoRadiSam system radical SAM enzyme, partial [Alphaproteobacteria bacterium]
WCHGCGALLVERDWYVLGAGDRTASGRCNSCGAACAGLFDGPAGKWGAKRQQVRLADFAA